MTEVRLHDKSGSALKLERCRHSNHLRLFHSAAAALLLSVSRKRSFLRERHRRTHHPPTPAKFPLGISDASEQQVDAPSVDEEGRLNSPGYRIGYARISTLDQNLALLQDALKLSGCEKIFIEQIS